MSDENFDPWKSLASELGVDPNAAPPPPPPPSPPAAAPKLFTPSAAPPETKKVPSDWRALASDLGIEVPPEPEAPVVRKDPVAELLGWPAQSRAPEPKEPEVRVVDDLEEREPWDVDDVRGRWGDEDDKPLDAADAESGPRPERRDERGGSREDGPRPGRRRRGGRGRGRGGDRGEPVSRGDDRGRSSHDRDDRRPRDQSARREEAPRDENRDLADDAAPAAELEGASDREREPVGDEETSRRPRRRRGRRRGRGGDRPERSQTGDQPKRKAPANTGHYDEPDSVAFGEDLEDIDEVERLDEAVGEEFAAARVTADDAHDDVDEDDGPRGGRNSVRDIMTWQEAIGIIIETNMQERARNPRSGGHGGHGGHGGRGRRGGRRNG